jgi:parvulin-like peptidyl-prolyl isomerase
VIDRIIATVGDEIITLFEAQQRAAASRNPLAELMAGEGPEAGKGIKDAIDDLIAERLLVAEGRKLEIEVSDAEVDKHIKGIQDQNGWSDSDFDAAVRMLGYRDAKTYRDHARKELQKSQVLRMRVGSKIRVTDREVEEAFNREYESGKSEEEIHLWHIVFRIPDSVTLPELKAVLEKAERVAEEARAGKEPFEELAKRYSEDGSAPKGGDVGYFPRGRLQPTLEDAAFGLKDGDVSRVVQSSAGFHVIRVTDRRRVPIHDVEESRARVRYVLSEEQFQKLYTTYIRELRATAHVEVRAP